MYIHLLVTQFLHRSSEKGESAQKPWGGRTPLRHGSEAPGGRVSAAGELRRPYESGSKPLLKASYRDPCYKGQQGFIERVLNISFEPGFISWFGECKYGFLGE